MRPLKLTLAGFTGVRDGMKRERVELDLEALPTGLIALVGPNGAGKTTIMDNLHPYRIMPSRSARLSVDAFSYWDHLCGVQAEKVFEWEHAGRRYRSSFAFRKPGKTGKAEYFLAIASGEADWTPVVLPDGTVSDGKAETYDRCVEAVCGSLESFFTSVFSAQNRRPLASYGANEIKGLLAELLKIEMFQRMATQASDVAKGLGKRLAGIQNELLMLSGKRDRLRLAEQHIEADSAQLAQVRQSREALSAELADLAQQRATLGARQAESATVTARLQQLQVRRTELDTAIKALTSENATALQRGNQRKQALSQTIAGHQATLQRKDSILGATARRDAALLEISREEGKQKDLQATLGDLEVRHMTLTVLESDLKRIQSEGQSKAAVIATYEKQAAVIDTVPCAGQSIHAQCPLLAQAREAKVHANEQRILVQELRNRFAAKRQEKETLSPVVNQLATRRSEITAINETLSRARKALQAATDLAAQKPLLDAAENGLSQAQAELRQVEAELVEGRTRRQAEADRLAVQVRELDAEVSRLGVADVSRAIADLDRQLSAKREAGVAADARIEALIRSQATRQAECDALARDLAGFDGTQVRADRLSDEIAHWKLLAKGLGNEGLIALTIDDAGPALTQTVNDLLLACYGTRFTVEIRTQRELASGDVREGFEILVHDAENDSTKAVGVMSGGQKVWINECLTRGIALYLARNAGQPYDTLFTDEADGALDPDRKRQFMKMKREVLRQGGYLREFFISQTPDLLDEADHVIDVLALAA